jgi:hypothetical protein
VAVARPTCLYCGAPLPPEVAAGASASAASAAADAPSWARTLLVLDLDGADPATLAQVLGLPPYQAGLHARRGGFHLHRVLDPLAAADEAARLRAGGLTVVLVPEVEARVCPVRATGGEPTAGALSLRTEEGSLVVRGEDLLLVVSGPVVRKYRPPLDRRKVDTATLEEGYRVHLHRKLRVPAVELDPSNFEFGFAVSGSTRLELDAWVAALAQGVPRDEGFRLLTPALGPSGPEPRGPLAADVLARAVSGRRGAGEDAMVVLDNAQQFRFYSAWRAAVERRRAAP